jgi:hypothetical protein
MHSAERHLAATPPPSERGRRIRARPAARKKRPGMSMTQKRWTQRLGLVKRPQAEGMPRMRPRRRARNEPQAKTAITPRVQMGAAIDHMPAPQRHPTPLTNLAAMTPEDQTLMIEGKMLPVSACSSLRKMWGTH